MEESTIDLSKLERALAQLRDAERFVRVYPVAGGEDIAIHLRAGAIQAFEFTYEATIGVLRRFVRAESTTTLAFWSFHALLREAFAMGAVRGDLRVWDRYRELRNRSSHTYDEPAAESVVEAIPGFIEEVAYVLERLRGA